MPPEDFENQALSIRDSNDNEPDTRRGWQTPSLQRLKLQDAEVTNTTVADGLFHS